MAYGDTIAYEWGEGADKSTLRFTYNANTFLIYKQFFDVDLMKDVLNLVKGTNIPKDVAKQIQSGELKVADIDKIELDKFSGASIDLSLFLQILIAMVATHERIGGKRRGVEEIANDIPVSILSDEGFFTQFSDLIVFGLKKTVKA